MTGGEIIYSSVDTTVDIEDRKEITKWISEAISEEQKELGEIAINLCSDDYIIEANRQYLNHNHYTDIITFDYSEREILSGDLLISVDTVKSNSQHYGVTFSEEIRRVIIHGILHLCGFNDSTDKEKKLMREREDYYLEKFSTIPL